MRKPTEFESHPVTYDTARLMGCFRAICKYVTDGDTYDFFIDLGLNQYAYDTIRLYDLDTAEIFHPSNAAEKAHGMAAKARAIELLDQKPVLLRSYKDAETFGRYVAEVYYAVPNPSGAGSSVTSLAETLKAEGFAKKASYA